MQPLWEAGNNLGLLDIKLKADNKKSKEINVGLSYRHNLNDQVILGIYSFFDRRTTGNNFSVNGLTAGVEALTKYVDLRANYYLPQDKKKKIEHNNKKQVKIQGTSIYAVTGGHKYEYSFKGFDMEIGASLLGFSDNLNEKFGTKVFVAYYDFRNKNTKSITGTRIRLEQKLGKISFGDNAMQFTLNAETQSDKVRKRQSSVGIGAKFIFKDKVRHKEGLRGRMLDMIVRDVDIVTESEKAADKVSNFVGDDGREINKLYFVAKVAPSSGYEGDGTAEKPYSTEQLKRLKLDDALVVVTKVDSSKGGANMTKQEYEELKALPQVVNGKKELNLVSKNTGEGDEKVSIAIKGEKGIKIVAEDAVNTTIEANIIPVIASSSTQQVQSQIIPSVAGAAAVVEMELISEPVVAELLTEVQEENIPVAPPLPEERVRENNNTNQQGARSQRESARRQRAQEEAERQETERRAAQEREERIARERAEGERLERERAERQEADRRLVEQRVQQEEAERGAAQEREERIARERAEGERLERERAERQEADRRLALQLAEQEEEDRRLAEQLVQEEEAEQIARAERERAEQIARAERERAEEERLERERAEEERLERERVEREGAERARENREGNPNPFDSQVSLANLRQDIETRLAPQGAPDARSA